MRGRDARVLQLKRDGDFSFYFSRLGALFVVSPMRRLTRTAAST